MVLSHNLVAKLNGPWGGCFVYPHIKLGVQGSIVGNVGVKVGELFYNIQGLVVNGDDRDGADVMRHDAGFLQPDT